MSTLFEPFALKSITLRNRIAVPPMCQYMATDGVVTEWHQTHYVSMARGGAGLVTIEATAVSPDGRITPHDTGIWNDEQAQAFVPIVRAIKAAGAVPGIQLAHAGRKGSAERPWEGGHHIAEGDTRGWQTIAPSAIAFGSAKLTQVPRAMTLDDIARVRRDFADAARRALEVGFEWLELHFAHGYLAQSFFAEASNQREDDYGGSAENRGRFLRETLQGVREVWPDHLPLTVRLGVIEYDGRDEQNLIESIELARRLKDAGLDLISVSSGISTPGAQAPWGPGFLVPIAERVRREAGIPVSTAWLDTATRAEKSVREHQIDLALFAKAHLANPHFAYAAARELGIERPSWATLPTPNAYALERQ